MIKFIPGLEIPVPCFPTPISLFSAPLPCFCTIFLLPHPAYNSNDLFGLSILVFVCLNQQFCAPVTPHGLVMMRPFPESWEFPVLKVQIVCTNDICYSIVTILLCRIVVEKINPKLKKYVSVMYLSDIKSSDHNCPAAICDCPAAIYNCPTTIYICPTTSHRNDYFVWMEQLHLSMKLRSQI